MKPHALPAWSPSRSFFVHLHVVNGLLLATVALLFLFYRASAPDISLKAELSSFPAQVGSWQKSADQDIAPEIVEVLGLEDWVERRYDSGPTNSVWIYVGYMGAWKTGKKRQAYHSPWFCYPAHGWEIIQQDLQPIAVPEEREIVVNKMLVKRGSERQLLLYWIQMGDRIIAEGYGGGLRTRLSWMLQLPYTLLANERTDRTIVRITAPVTDSVEATLSRQIDFIQAAFPILSSYFSLETGEYDG
jgi:EpsI family protein